MEKDEVEHVLNLAKIMGYIHLYPHSITERVLINDNSLTESEIQQRIAENDEFETPVLAELLLIKEYSIKNPKSILHDLINKLSREIQESDSSHQSK